MWKGALAAPLLVLAAASCGADVTVEGEIGGRSFDLATVYGWIDATQEDLNFGEGKIVFSERERKDLHIVLSGAAYDPEVDVRFLSVDQILNRLLDEERNGVITLRISDSDAVSAGVVLTDPSQGDGPELEVDHNFAAVRIESDAVYPAEVSAFGSRTAYTLTVDEIQRDGNRFISGTLVVAVERADTDPQGVQTGSITVRFSAKLIGERIAECNNEDDRDQLCDFVVQ